MPRRLVQAMYLVAIGIVLFAGFSIYRSSQNTAQHAGQVFVQRLIKGDVHDALGQGTPALQDKTQVINQLSQQLRADAAGQVQIISKEPFYDTFDAYPTGSMPTRLVYGLELQAKKYRIVIITYEQDGAWQVDSVSGAYVQ